jgi:hypothetical protein
MADEGVDLGGNDAGRRPGRPQKKVAAAENRRGRVDDLLARLDETCPV